MDHHGSAAAADWRRRVLDLLFPPRCAGCRRRGVWLCELCRDDLVPLGPQWCPRCAAEVARAGPCSTCRAAPPAFDVVYAAYRYAGPLSPAIKRFKYHGERGFGVVLGALLADAAVGLGLDVDLVVPVPLHPERRRSRGYNQSELLAACVADRLGRPLSRALLRTRPTPPQVGQDAAARRRNVADAFAWTGPPLSSQRLLLVDDVCTTGATFGACARALRAYGPAGVTGLALARQ